MNRRVLGLFSVISIISVLLLLWNPIAYLLILLILGSLSASIILAWNFQKKRWLREIQPKAMFLLSADGDLVTTHSFEDIPEETENSLISGVCSAITTSDCSSH